MSYTINLTNGTTLVPGGLSDGHVDTSHTSLTLIGKDYAGYGQFLNENFVYLLENFANTSSPSNPLVGQLWWDKTNNILKVYSGNSWKISTGATASPFSAPPVDLSILGGDLWYDSTNQQLKVYSGSGWIVVGPAARVDLQTTGVVAATISDTASVSHKVVQLQFNGVVYAIFAYETFTTTTPGFINIKAGINFKSDASPNWQLSNQDVNATPNTLVQRDGSGGITVGAVNGSSLNVSTITATSVINGTFNGNLTGNVSAGTVSATTVQAQSIQASSGINGTLYTAAQPNITSVGTLNGLSVNGTVVPIAFTGTATLNGQQIATSNNTVAFTAINGTPIGNASPNSGAFTTLQIYSSLTPVSNLVVNLGGTSNFWNGLFANTATILGTLTAGAIGSSLIPSANLTYNLGSPTMWFNNIYGRSIQALYADLAERFHADAEYAPGTVVEMGGINEITKVVEECSERVFGVISTNAAYLMNSSAGTDATHPPVAMSGRVPVRVVGMIVKGDRLVSAGNGMARTGLRTELTAFNVIGRALENKIDTNEGVIEAIVKLNS